MMKKCHLHSHQLHATDLLFKSQIFNCQDTNVCRIWGQRGLPLANLGVLKSSLDTSVAALSAIASQPPLMGNVDPSKIDEIRRTVYVGNLNSQVCDNELEFMAEANISLTQVQIAKKTVV